MLTRYPHRIPSIFLWPLLLFAPTTAIGQCQDGPSFHKELNEITRDDNPLIIRQLLDLVKQGRNCHLQDSTMAQILHVLGRSLWYENKLDSAVLITRQAIRINTSGGTAVQPANLCHSYYNLASILMQRGDLNSALKELDEAIKVGRKHKSKLGTVANSFCLKSSLLTSLGDYDKTLAAAYLGYRYAALAGRLDLVVKSQIEKAQALIELDSLEQAQSTLSNALDICNKNQFKQLHGSIYSLLADLKSRQNLPLEVTKLYLLAFDCYKNVGFSYGCGEASQNLGHYYQSKLFRPDKALYYYKSALKYTNTRTTRGLLYSNISIIFKIKGNFNEACSISQKALTEAGFQLSPNNIAQNPPASAFLPMLDKSAMLMIIQSKATTWLEAARAHSNDAKELSVALATFALADTLVDQMRWEHTGRTSKLFWREKTRDLYESAIETCYLLNNPEKALYFFEKSRAAMLNDQLNESGAAAALSPADRQKEATLKSELRVLQTTLSDASNATSAGIREKLLVKQEEFEKFIKKLEKTNPRYYAYKFNTQVPTLAEIREKLLAKNQAFLSYFSGENAMYGLLIDQKQIQLRKIGVTGLTETLSKFQTLLSNRELQNRDLPHYLNQAHQIYQATFRPFNLKPGTRVIVSPDGILVPFQALSKSPNRAAYLVYDHPISYTYSAGYLIKARRAEPQLMNFKNFLGFAPVKFQPESNQPDLRASDLAMERITERLYFPKLLTGAKATRSAFTKAANEYRIVQLLTHAEADSAHIIPKIYFADSSLSLNDLPEGRPWRTQLMVLSACRTGVGKNQRGEGVFSLARGFSGLGIPSVLTTLWNVENEPVYNLTEYFFQDLAKDDPLDVAMQKAQMRQLKSTNRAAQLPYSWAGLVLIGNTAPISSGFLQTPWAATIPAFFLLLFLLIGIKRKWELFK